MAYACQSALDLEDQYLDAIFNSLSVDRMASYLAAVAKNDRAQALVLYGYNQSLAALFYELLSNIEVALRNRIHNRLSILYSRRDWFELIKPVLNEKRSKAIDDAIAEIESQGEDLSSGLIISKLNFGFWTALFEKRCHNAIWVPGLRLEFPGLNRSSFHSDLMEVRELRNSIAHHERLLKLDLVAKLEKAETVLAVVCPALLEWSRPRLCAKIRECLAELSEFLKNQKLIDDKEARNDSPSATAKKA